MENIGVLVIIPLAITIIGGVVVLAIEYDVFQPRLGSDGSRHKKRIASGVATNRSPQMSKATIQVRDSAMQESERLFSPSEPYRYVLVGVLGGFAGFASVAIPWVTLEIAPKYNCFLYALVVMAVIGGMILALVIDKLFRMDSTVFWQRYPLSVIVGVLGGWLGIILCVIALFLFDWLQNDLRNQRRNGR